ncbi:MAG: MFS transporter [Chloroflexi bacterium]|nr:MFS transporter [Chloroflexota bacterium]
MAISHWRGNFTALDDRRFRWFLLSSSATFAAQQMQIVVRGWLVYDMTGSALALGWVSIGAGAPLLLFSPLGGVIGDRVDKRNLLFLCQVLMLFVTLPIALLVLLDAIDLWHLVVVSVAQGFILAFDLPSRSAIVPQLVETRHVMNAVGLSSSASNLNRVIAPAMGGALVGIMGIDGVYFLMSGCFVASTALLFRIPSLETPPRHQKRTLTGDITEGLGVVRRSPVLRWLLIAATVPIAFGMPYMMLMPIFARDVLDVGASGLGYLMGMTGIGALLGSMVVASLGNSGRKGLILIGAVGVFGLSLMLFASSQQFWLCLVFLFGVGAANSIHFALTNTLLLVNTEDKFQGRVMGLYVITIGLLPIAVLPASAIAEAVGVQTVVLGGGSILALFAVVLFFFRPSLRRL